MRVKTTIPPIDEISVVEVRRLKNGILKHTIYRTQSVVIGECEYVRDSRWWVIDDGTVIPTLSQVEEYIKRKVKQTPQPLEPGVYTATYTGVSQSPGKVILHLTSGEDLTILNK